MEAEEDEERSGVLGVSSKVGKEEGEAEFEERRRRKQRESNTKRRRQRQRRAQRDIAIMGRSNP